MGKKKSDPDEMLTTEQAAELLGLSARQVRQHVERGKLAAVRFGLRSWMFRRGDVEAFKPAPRGRPKT